MFIGHHAAAFVSERIAPRLSLGLLFAASMWIDLLWPILLLCGVEHVAVQPGYTEVMPLNFIDYPISHSLAMVLVWSVLWGAGYYLYAKWMRGAVIVGLTVLSHWVLDLFVHRADLPLWPGGPEVGFNIWRSPLATNCVEVPLFVIALILYLRLTRPLDRIGSIALWALVAFLAFVHISYQVRPPWTDARSVAWSMLLAWLLVPWAWWIDKHRETRMQ